jgi:hypothetical protein
MSSSNIEIWAQLTGMSVEIARNGNALRPSFTVEGRRFIAGQRVMVDTPDAGQVPATVVYAVHVPAGAGDYPAGAFVNVVRVVATAAGPVPVSVTCPLAMVH